jgi:hypothetical protein
MSPLEELFLEIETHAVLRSHDGLVKEARIEYEKLKDDSNRLESLQCYGVDNWQGYDDAMQYYSENYLEK